MSLVHREHRHNPNLPYIRHSSVCSSPILSTVRRMSFVRLSMFSFIEEDNEPSSSSRRSCTSIAEGLADPSARQHQVGDDWIVIAESENDVMEPSEKKN